MKGGCGRGNRSGRRPKRQKPPKKTPKSVPKSKTHAKFSRRSTTPTGELKFNGYRIIDFDKFFGAISSNLRCQCGGEVSVKEKGVLGLFSCYDFTCETCGKVFSVESCEKIGAAAKAPDINRRFVYAMGTCGQGLGGMSSFCEVMDLPPPVQQTSYSRIKQTLVEAQKFIATKSMIRAANLEAEGGYRLKRHSVLR